MMYHNSSCSRTQLLQQINEVSFAVDDLLLYLDTHPCCEKGMALYKEYAEKRKNLMKKYAECYGPLTIDDALETNADTWKWMEQPFPWADSICGIMKKDCSIQSISRLPMQKSPNIS